MCGKEGRADHLGDVMVMASVADRLEMLEVCAALEAAIIGELQPEVCVEALMSSRRLGLGHPRGTHPHRRQHTHTHTRARARARTHTHDLFLATRVRACVRACACARA